jgi:hypothetical protein
MAVVAVGVIGVALAVLMRHEDQSARPAFEGVSLAHPSGPPRHASDPLSVVSMASPFGVGSDERALPGSSADDEDAAEEHSTQSSLDVLLPADVQMARYVFDARGGDLSSYSLALQILRTCRGEYGESSSEERGCSSGGFEMQIAQYGDALNGEAMKQGADSVAWGLSLGWEAASRIEPVVEDDKDTPPNWVAKDQANAGEGKRQVDLNES